MLKIGNYTREQLKKTILPYEYWERVLSPEDSKFVFEVIDNKPITITPIKDIPVPQVRQCVDHLYQVGILKPQNCYENAVAIAIRLRQRGLTARCIDGYFRPVGSNEWLMHRFNEIQGFYFDATAELFYSPFSKREYKGVRAFDALELVAVSVAFDNLCYKTYDYLFMSTLPYNEQDLAYCEQAFPFYLDNNGRIRAQDNAA